MLSPTKRQLLPYAIVTLFGFIGFSLPLPILPEMFLDPHRSILPESYSIGFKTFLLGLMMASFPLGQLFGSPLLGRLSDKYGRKSVILYSLSGSTIGYLITACSIAANAIWGIFFGLLFCGFCEGNIAIAQSVIADITENESPAAKAGHFGFINLFVTLGFVIGPLVGGQLADPSIASWFSFDIPFWTAAIMTVIGICIIALCSKETRNFDQKVRNQSPLSFWKLISLPKLKVPYLASFFLALAIFSFFRFFPVFIERMFDFTTSELAYAISYDSIAFAVGLIWIVKPLAHRFSPTVLTAAFTLALALLLTVFVMPKSTFALFFTIPPIGMCLAVAITNGSVMVSNAASPEQQGHALGTLTSIQVLAEVLTGLFGGLLAAKHPSLPLYLGALMAVVCSFILFTSVNRMRKMALMDKDPT